MVHLDQHRLLALSDLAVYAASVDAEGEWWELAAQLVLGSLFSAQVMALMVLDVEREDGRLSVVHPATAGSLVPVAPVLEQILPTDLSRSAYVATAPAHEPLEASNPGPVAGREQRLLRERVLVLPGGARCLALLLGRSPSQVELLLVVRSSPDFSPVEMELAARLRALLQLGMLRVRQEPVPTVSASGRTIAMSASVADALGISRRELSVLDLVDAGRTTRSIARELQISPRTVYKHEQSVYRKLGVSDRVNALREARHHLLLPVTERW